MTYEIEKGVPVPRLKSQYRWLDMEVKDSFFVPIADRKGSVVRSAASWANKNYAPKRWIVRTVEGGHRVWREL